MGVWNVGTTGLGPDMLNDIVRLGRTLGEDKGVMGEEAH